ncbi:DUF547 domain-containing protein [Fulvivirgaceae bacterium LMO-SS25]
MLRLFSLLLIITSLIACQGESLGQAGTQTPNHDVWTTLLKIHVDENGKVNYQGFIRDKAKLESYLNSLSNTPPDRAKWTEAEQLAYWINAYNAFTVKLIVDNYPVKSIQDLHPTFKIPMLNTVWHKKFFKIGGEDASLDQIEHKILRKEFEEPRIHFAINCASISCPPLRNEAYTAAKLEQQLEDQAKRYINNPSHNKIQASQVKVSKIFSWFSGDFTKNGNLIDYLNKYSKTQISPNAKVSYMDYNWDLNE